VLTNPAVSKSENGAGPKRSYAAASTSRTVMI
jgi:hypothetical protein